MEAFWRSWDNSLSESLLYYCIFRYILFWGVTVGGGGTRVSFLDKLRSQFNYERIFWK